MALTAEVAPSPAAPTRVRGMDRLLALTLGVSGVLFALRWLLAGRLGFGDAEALYASYAYHLAPGYFDHPGVIALVHRLLAGSGPADPEVAHRFTTLFAGVVPWIGALAARALGADARGSYRTVLALSLTPELSLGLFALTPDLLLAALWLASLALTLRLFAQAPNGIITLVLWLALGTCLGLSMLAKVPGALLTAVVLLTTLRAPLRQHWGTLGPWLAFGIATLLLAPLLHWEVTQGLPMLTHRLVTTQSAAGISLRNVGAVVGGQLLYVTPPFLAGAWFVMKRLHGQRRTDPRARFLLLAAALPGSILLALCLWSRVAEPHWLAPAYLSLAIGVSRLPTLPRWLSRSATAVGLVAIVTGALLVTTPLTMALSGASYRPRYDLVNDLYAWSQVKDELQGALTAADARAGAETVIVGPHWTVCAQVHALLGPSRRVGCDTPVPDDFDGWFPRAEWRASRSVLYVTDDRFSKPLDKALPAHEPLASRELPIRRHGRVVRTVTLVAMGLP